MNFIESIKVAISAIWVNKMRSLLTMLGIIIGISSVIAVVALGQGSKNMMNKEFESFGVNRAAIWHNWRKNPTSKDYMNHEDLKALRRAFEKEISAMSHYFDTTGEIVAGKEKKSVYIYGVEHEYNNIDKKEIIKGRYLVEGDIKAKRNVVVIDEELALDIFGRTNVLGERIIVNTRTNSISPVIVGIYKNKKSLFSGGFGGNSPKYLYLPVSTVEKMFGVGDRVYMVEMNLKQGVNIEETLNKMIKLLERRHGNAGKDKYRSYNAESEMESVNKITSVMTMVVGAIAAISLLVGGIGVMNIMLVSVTERTREIGIRKAIGARHRDILLQFLVEAVIISGIGGMIGTILGIGFSYIISNFIKIPPTVSPMTILIAWVFSAGVGIFFGIYPANKAAKLDPIEALRYE
ncbi:ABC transporter permease [Paramaledivibacter caminithermalis]|uniref:Putative ABC transport system permease protein n=1 Tax=Paramaledivibacter caminithermalis (strain DSM 15212 / CIP 107654 / DViRD3) TaxID=1121301 RepID=A0A1M6L8Q9_PARC5|nr:ABC transporter permease [Paramaledivibacter caminithermalis]SHJ67555.1 putative ABC transport system permease protein [Paramaledivibacter caminithermalis DSM 15212]